MSSLVSDVKALKSTRRDYPAESAMELERPSPSSTKDS